MIKLTARQQQVMDVIKSSIEATGMPPTRADIARELGCNEISVETLKKCIRKGTIEFKFVPVLCGTAFKNKGVQPSAVGK